MKVLGIDSGHKIGHCIVDVSNSVIKYINKGVLETGTKVALAVSRKAGRGEQSSETRLYDDDLHLLRASAARIIGDAVSNGVKCVGLERIYRVVPMDKSGGKARVSSQQATCLVQSSWIGGELAAQAAMVFGQNVFTFSAMDARGSVVGGRPTDADVSAFITRHVIGWPKQSNNHERDAAIVAIYLAKQIALGVRKVVS